MTPRIAYWADVTNNTIDEHKYFYGISDTPFKERYENHKTSFTHRSHLVASDLSKDYWKLVDNGTVLTVKFSIAKRVKDKLFINNDNLCLSEKAVMIRNVDDINILKKRSELIIKCRHINKWLLIKVKDDSNDWLWCVFVFNVCFVVLVMKSFCSRR